MNIKRLFLAAAAAVASGALSSTPVFAGEILYDGAGFIQGSQSLSDSFNLASAGTLTVTLGDIGWPQPLSSLNLLVTSANGALGPEMGAGTETFNLGAGNIDVQWFGSAQGALDAGVYSLKIQFAPTASSNPVPLPTSIGLLVSGLILLAWQRRSRPAGLADDSMSAMGQDPGVQTM